MLRSVFCRLAPAARVPLAILFCLLLASPVPVQAAQDLSTQGQGSGDTAGLSAEIARASRLFGIPSALVLAIARVESSGNPWCVTVEGREMRASNARAAASMAERAMRQKKSVDIGLMQINSWWLRRLALSPARALEPRVNIFLGLWILAREYRRHGRIWKAVGAYHSPTPWRQERYARKVARAYAHILRAEETEALTLPAAAAR